MKQSRLIIAHLCAPTLSLSLKFNFLLLLRTDNEIFAACRADRGCRGFALTQAKRRRREGRGYTVARRIHPAAAAAPQAAEYCNHADVSRALQRSGAGVQGAYQKPGSQPNTPVYLLVQHNTGESPTSNCWFTRQCRVTGRFTTLSLSPRPSLVHIEPNPANFPPKLITSPLSALPLPADSSIKRVPNASWQTSK